MKRAIIFDLFGVILPNTLWLLADRHVPNTDEATHNSLAKIINKSDSGIISQKEFWTLAAEVFGTNYDDLIKEKDSLGRADENLLKYIESIKKQGYRVGLLSNVGHGFVDNYIDKTRQDKLFDSMILSGEVGFLKPDKEIYNISVKDLGVNANACLFFDDSKRNVLAAREVGLHSEVYTSLDKCIIDTNNFLKLTDTYK